MERTLFQEKFPYLTTPYLLSMYAGYKSPRDKIKQLVESGDLVHIKQGLYILGEAYGREYSREVLSGMIYGPSAISLEYALSFHGLIPERVEEVTCICFKRDKKYHTPIGRFSYKYLPAEKYTCGINFERTELGNFFIASPEKALCDTVYFSSIKQYWEVPGYLLDELRIDTEQLKKLDIALLAYVSGVYKRKSCQYLLQAITRLKQEKE